MNRKVTRKSTTTPRRIALELRHDRDGRYRWYEQVTDADTEVSATTPAQAWQDAAHVWGADVWDFKRVSDTTATINADDGAVTSIIEKSIREEFPGRHNKGLRAKVRKAAATGYPGVVRDIASQVALTANGRASLEAVARAMMPAYTMSQRALHKALLRIWSIPRNGATNPDDVIVPVDERLVHALEVFHGRRHHAES